MTQMTQMTFNNNDARMMEFNRGEWTIVEDDNINLLVDNEAVFKSSFE